MVFQAIRTRNNSQKCNGNVFFSFTGHVACKTSHNSYSMNYNLQETLHTWSLSWSLHMSAAQCGSDTATEADCGRSSMLVFIPDTPRICNGCMPVRAVCKPHSPDLKRGALATDARGCSLWRDLLERLPPAPESRVRDPLGEWVWTRVGGGYIGAVTRMGVRFRGVSVTDVCQ